MKIPKQMLKKCRFCNFKKRSCQINPENCQAKKSVCWNCKKPGHFTQSLCCKKRRTANKRKLPKLNIELPKSTLSTKEHLNLIYKTIKKLENLINLDKRSNEEDTYQDINQLNKSVADGGEHQVTIISKVTENMNHELSLKKQILKSANYCARKFKNLDYVQIY